MLDIMDDRVFWMKMVYNCVEFLLREREGSMIYYCNMLWLCFLQEHLPITATYVSIIQIFSSHSCDLRTRLIRLSFPLTWWMWHAKGERQYERRVVNYQFTPLYTTWHRIKYQKRMSQSRSIQSFEWPEAKLKTLLQYHVKIFWHLITW